MRWVLSYDPVGNRLTRSVLNLPLVPQTFNFDADDRLTSDTYDANGNTTVGHLLPGTPAVRDSYDFENRLTGRTNPDGSTISILYDGDGNRVQKTVTTATNSLTTRYLVDDPAAREETMDTAAERIFGFVRGATREYIRMDLRPRSDKAQSQKDLSPKGLINNRAVPAGRDCS